MKLKDRVAIVTGSSMGIGEAIARLYAQNGARVVINSRSLERARKVADELVRAGFEALPIEADVAEGAEVDRMVRQTEERWGRLDILVNNAGTSMIAPSVELAEADWRRTLDVDLTGPFLCARAAARVMIARGGGVILNISSILGETGLQMRAAYCAAKHGLIGLTKVLAVEWARHRIRVVAINPGYIQTPMDVGDQSSGGYTPADIRRRTPQGRYGTADEVARCALFLASEDATYITGSVVNVDGGWLAYGGW
ncbi:MAG: glucose 1-dehydrogenase [Candidatus Rokubacteria bacterium]|nr:glucose 1-dehydrogenase [Candidatus Rokubacteria bacterium]